MKFALLNNDRIEARPKLVAECIYCGEKVRSYCGKIMVHHWKHVKLKECDNWHEFETEWHRNWKNKFEKENQEVVMFDSENREKHIADVHLKNINLTIEFQHSPLEIQEIQSREAFYENMIWVVDLIPFKKYISFTSNFQKAFDAFTNNIINSDCQKSINLEDSDLVIKILESEIAFDKICEYYREVKQTFFPSYFANCEKSSSARRLLKSWMEEKRDNPNVQGYSYSDENIKNYQAISKLDKADIHLLMIWKNKHKRWYSAKKPIFFDLGDDYLYRNMENIKSSNGIVVKRYNKEKFVRHYKEKNKI